MATARVGGTRNRQPIPRQPTAAARNVSTPEEEAASRQSRAEGGGFWSGSPLKLAGDILGSPIVNPIGYAGGKVGQAVSNKLGFDPVAAVQDPVGAALDYAGAPDAVQLVANPTGFATRTAVNAGTQYGTNVPRIASAGIQAGQNVVNDANNAANAVGSAINAAGEYFGDLTKPAAAKASVAGTAQASTFEPRSVERPDSYRSEGGIQRPDSYRSDDAMTRILGLLNAERRQGPSEAEALLHQATDRAAGQALGIAAGARGGAGARSRARQQAISANAALGSRASQDVAALRAREDADSRARQAQIMGLYSGAAQSADARDLGYAQADQTGRIAADNLDLGYTQADVNAQQAQAELANTAYQAEANRELQRAIYNSQRPVGFLDDPVGSLFTRLFGGPLRSQPKI